MTMKLPAVPMSLIDKDYVPLAEAPLAVRFAQAVLLLHRGGAWTQDDYVQWRRLTGTPLATTKALGDMARRVIEEATSPESTPRPDPAP